MNNRRIMFLRSAGYRPVGCLAITLDAKKHTISYQYSVLNPTDTFNRKMARQLALGRLVEAPISLPMGRDAEINMHSVSHAVMSHLAASKAPNRAVRAAKLWLTINQSYDL